MENNIFKLVHDGCDSDLYCWVFQRHQRPPPPPLPPKKVQNLVIPVLCNMYCEITKEFKTSVVF